MSQPDYQDETDSSTLRDGGSAGSADSERRPGTPAETPATAQHPSETVDDLEIGPDDWTLCTELAQAPQILMRLKEELRTVGLAGEQRGALLIYLALTSRLQDRPVSIAVKGPSSAGKSNLVEQVLRFFPQSAYYCLSAMSDKVLAYSDEPLSHRFLVLYEAAGLRGEFANYFIRSLLSEGRLRYEVVIKNDEGIKTQLIEREGPTGLITTTTRIHLHLENETRYLSVPVDDSTNQTRKVLMATAQERQVTKDAKELKPWLALQRWLETGERRVVIPFAKTLAELIPPVAVRLRRDFVTFLNLIRSHALLHRASRQRDRDGRIIAEFRDYKAVRLLVADLIAESVEATVAPSIRQTVAAVAQLTRSCDEGASVTQVATALRLDKSAASRRIRAALDRGYLKNLETHRGLPYRLVLGDELPDDIEILPDPKDLERRCCAVAVQLEGKDPEGVGH